MDPALPGPALRSPAPWPPLAAPLGPRPLGSPAPREAAAPRPPARPPRGPDGPRPAGPAPPPAAAALTAVADDEQLEEVVVVPGHGGRGRCARAGGVGTGLANRSSLRAAPAAADSLPEQTAGTDRNTSLRSPLLLLSSRRRCHRLPPSRPAPPLRRRSAWGRLCAAANPAGRALVAHAHRARALAKSRQARARLPRRSLRPPPAVLSAGGVGLLSSSNRKNPKMPEEHVRGCPRSLIFKTRPRCREETTVTERPGAGSRRAPGSPGPGTLGALKTRVLRLVFAWTLLPRCWLRDPTVSRDCGPAAEVVVELGREMPAGA